MLILTRRISESLIINDDVKVTVLGAKGNNVRIGIEAPKNIPVHREEVYNQIQLEQEMSGNRKDNDCPTSKTELKKDNHVA